MIGVDIEDMGGYPAKMFLIDVNHFNEEVLRMSDIPAGRKVSLVVASPPCQQFSITRQPFHKPHVEKLKREGPDQKIWKACERIAQELNAPLVLENVQGAVKWMGKETWHYGSFYFWGINPFQAMLDMRKLIFAPQPYYDEKNDKYSNRKGFRRKNKNFNGKSFQGNGPDGKTWVGNVQGSNKSCFVGEYERVNPVGKGMSRKQWSAIAAMIPEELSYWIGQCFYPQELKTSGTPATQESTKP